MRGITYIQRDDFKFGSVLIHSGERLKVGLDLVVHLQKVFSIGLLLFYCEQIWTTVVDEQCISRKLHNIWFVLTAKHKCHQQQTSSSFVDLLYVPLSLAICRITYPRSYFRMTNKSNLFFCLNCGRVYSYSHTSKIVFTLHKNKCIRITRKRSLHSNFKMCRSDQYSNINSPLQRGPNVAVKLY